MFKLIKLLIILLFATLGSTCVAQQWVQHYEGHTIGDVNSTDSKAFSLAVGDEGSSYVIGYSSIFQTSYMSIVKYDQNGDTVWTASFNGGNEIGENKAYAVVVDKLRNVLITGYSTTANGRAHITTIKYTPQGEQIWARIYDDTTNYDNKAYAITLDSYNNIYVTGYSTVSENETHYITMKYDTAGIFQWKKLSEGNSDTATCISIKSDNYVVVTGRSTQFSPKPDIVTIVYDLDGNPYKINSLGLADNTEAKGNAITTDADGNVYVTGYVTRDTTHKDLVIIKYNSAELDTAWTKIIDGAGLDDIGNAIGLSANNDVLVTGVTSVSSTDAATHYITASYSSDGNSEWTKMYDGPGNYTDVAHKLAISTTDNSVYVTGTSQTDTTLGTQDMYTIKYDITSGAVIDSSRFSTGTVNADVANDIAIDANQNVYLTGYTLPTGGNSLNTGAKFLTLKYGNFKTNHKNTVINSVPKTFRLYQNYPNPFNPGTIIKFEIGKSSSVKLVVYDIIGKEVQTLINNNLNSGTYSVNFTKPGLSSGVYFYVLTAGDFRDIKKMVLLK